MELTLNIGDNINIPENCEINVNNNVLTIKEKIPFKDGDILHANSGNTIVIFARYRNGDFFDTYYNTDSSDNTYWNAHIFRHASEREKQKFLDDLRSKGLQWNAETKRMENIGKRVKKYERYLYINSYMDVIEKTDEYSVFDNQFYALGNYYLLSEQEQAEKDALMLKDFFFKERLT
jgi:hypothetical protein